MTIGLFAAAELNNGVRIRPPVAYGASSGLPWLDNGSGVGTFDLLAYSKVSGTPVLGTAAYENVTAFLRPSQNLSDLASASTARTNLGLATVAATGSYNDLSDKPTLSGSNSGDVTLSGESYLTISGQVITMHAVDLSGSHVTGTLAASHLPNPSASTLGGIQSAAAQSHKWINSISTSGVPSLSQPDYADISGLESMAQQAASSVAISGGTITGMPTPSVGSDVATKSYVDSMTTGLTPKNACRVATTANLSATYSNGSSGVGATLTNSGTQVAISIDGVSLSSGNRVLVKNQSTTEHNGVYTVTTVGDGSSNWVLTRAADFDGSSEIEGGYTVVQAGTANVGTMWIETGAGPFTVGTTSITFTQLAVASQTVTLTGDATGSGAGSFATTVAKINGVSLGSTTATAGNLLVASGTAWVSVAVSGDATLASTGAVTLATVASAGSAGSSTAIPNFTVDAKGRITAYGTNAVVAPAGTLSGTTLNATVVTSSLTSVGTIGTGVWQGTVVGATYGGTGVNNGSNTLTLSGNNAVGKWGVTANGAASTPSVSITGTPYTAGNATTNYPLVYLNCGVTQPTTLSTGGTALGFNLPSGYAGAILAGYINGTQVISINYDGGVTSAGHMIAGQSFSFICNGRSRLSSPSDGKFMVANAAVSGFTQWYWGGTTDSFASIVISGTETQFKLGGGSTDSAIRAGAATFTGTVTIPTAISGMVKAASGVLSAGTAGTDYVAPGTATTFTKQQVFGIATLTDGATISWDVSVAQVAKVTLGGNRTLAAPTNAVAGGSYILYVIQDGTGSRGLTLNSAYKKASADSAYTPSTGAGQYDVLTFVTKDGTNFDMSYQKNLS